MSSQFPHNLREVFIVWKTCIGDQFLLGIWFFPLCPGRKNSCSEAAAQRDYVNLWSPDPLFGWDSILQLKKKNVGLHFGSTYRRSELFIVYFIHFKDILSNYNLIKFDPP